MAAKKKPKKAPLPKRKPGPKNVRKEKGEQQAKGGKRGQQAKRGKRGQQAKRGNNTKLRKGRVLVKNDKGEWVDKIRSDAANAQWFSWETKGGDVVKPRKGKMRLSDARTEKTIYDMMMRAEMNGKLEEAMQDLAEYTDTDIGECYTDYYFSPKAAEFMG